MSTLDRAFAFTQINDVAMLIAQHLNFNVTRAFDKFLDEYAIVAEACQAFALHAFKTLANVRSEEHTSELQSLMRISYAVFCLKKKTNTKKKNRCTIQILNTNNNTQQNTHI